MTTYLTGEHHGPVELSNRTTRPQVCAEVSAPLLDLDCRLTDWLVGFTLDTLDSKHVEIRVLPALSERLVVATAHHPYLPSSRGRSEVP